MEANNQPNTINTMGTQNNIINQKPKWSVKKLTVIIVGIAAGIVIAIAGLFMFVNTATSAPLKVSDQFILNIQGDNAAAAYKLMSTDAQNATSSEEFMAAMGQAGPILSGKPNNISKEVNTSTNKGTTAKMIYEVAGSDSNTYTLTVNLVQENNEWKVINFESVKK